MTPKPPDPARAPGADSADPPLVSTSGGPRGRGRQYGAAARERVLLSLENYEKLYAHFAGVDWRAATAVAETFVPVIERFNADHLEEMAGIADGAGVEFADILALNLRTEILFSARARAAAPPAECTAFADLRGPDPIVGQNWDWLPFAHRTIVVLRTEPTNGPRWVSVVEAGLLAKFGMNSAGLTVLTNALVSSVDRGRPGVPYHLLLRALLESESAAAAEEVLRSADRSSSANYLLATADRAVDLEARPGGPGELARREIAPGTVFVHTNHFTAPAGDFGTPAEDRGPAVFLDTLDRRARATALAGSMPYPSVASWREVLRDHDRRPESICCHPDPATPELRRSSTVAGTIVEPGRQLMHLSLGRPCTTPWVTYAYRDFFRGRG
ncbi:C45 family autoproteolytic acyltransferase/hydrolase [Streptomyces sp. NPDC003691]